MLVAKPKWMLLNKQQKMQHMSMPKTQCYHLQQSYVPVMRMLCTV